MLQFAPTPVTFFNLQGSEGQASPRRNVADPLRLGDSAHHISLRPQQPPHFHLDFFLVLWWMRGNKNILHSGNCRPLCGLSILALNKFMEVERVSLLWVAPF